MNALTVHTWPGFFMACGRTSTRVSWREGMRLRDAIAPDWVERPALWVVVNGVRADDLDLPVWPEDLIDVTERPADPATALITSTVAGKTTVLLTAGGLIGGLTASFFAYAIYSMMARQKGPRKRDDGESAAYSFGGPQNSHGEGQPREYCYGLMRVAGTPVNTFTRERETPIRTDFCELISLGWGPITAVGQYTQDNNVAVPLSSGDPANPIPDGTELNGNPAKNFRGVKMHIRTGTQNQEPIPGFENIYTHYAVNQRLRQVETSGGSNLTLNSAIDPALVPYNADAGSPSAPIADAAQGVWTEKGVKFTTSEQHDAGTAVVSFPGGLYGIDPTNGSLDDAGFAVAGRYKQVDALGNTIDIGGDHGNGYVYIRPLGIFVAHEQHAFARQYSWTFYDPLTYTAPTAGKCLDASTSGDYGATAALNSGNLPASWAPGNKPTAFTIELWASFQNLTQANVGTSTANKTRALVSWWSGNSTSGNGFGLGIEAVAYTNWDTTEYRWVPTGYAGTGTTKKTLRQVDAGGFIPGHHVKPLPSAQGAKHHFVLTYTQDPSDQPGYRARYRLYMNGELIKASSFITTADQMTAPTSAQPIEMSRSIVNSAWGVAADGLSFIDEPLVHDRELTSAEVELSYSYGRGTYHAAAGTLVAAYHFDAAGSPSADYSGRANNLTLNGGANAGTTPGHVDVPGVGTPLVARWQVELVRENMESNATRIQDESVFDVFYGRLDRNLAYPNLALASMEVTATDQLSGSRPTRTHLVKGRQCPVWDGRSLVSPRITKQYSANTAWVTLAAATEEQSSQRFTYDKINWPRWKEFADDCDTIIYDGKGYFQTLDSASGAEPIADLHYDSTLNDGFGGVQIYFRPGFRPPHHWTVGHFVRFEDLPSHANIDVDLNVGGAQDGWEITEVLHASTSIVTLKFDKATYGDPWTDGQDWTTVTNPQPLTGTASGGERKFEFDACFDTFGEFWDVIRAILSTARAQPVLEDGDVLSVRYAHPDLPVAMLTKANTTVDVDDGGIAVSSFEVERVGTRGLTNLLELQIFDRDRGYKDSPVSVRGAMLAPGQPRVDVVVEPMNLFGVVRRGQAHRWGNFYIKALHGLRTKGKARVGYDLKHVCAGDLVTVANDLLPWGKSGRVVSSPATNQVKLDRAVTIPATTTYLTVRIGALGQTDDGSDHMQTLQLSTGAGTYAAGTTLTLTSNFTTSPEKGDLWILYQTKVEMEVMSRREISRTVAELELIEHDESIFDGVDVLTTELQPGGISLGKG